MKKKISVFALLLSFLFGIVVPVQAKAATNISVYNEYAFEEWCVSNDLPCEFKTSLTDDELSRTIHYIGFLKGNNYYVFRFTTSSDFCNVYYSEGKLCIIDPSTSYGFYATQKSASSWSNCYVNQDFVSCPSVTSTSYSFADKYMIFSTLDVYSDSECSDVYFESSVSIPDFYSFEDWCSDAGLNCTASINETEELYDFTFNSEDYYYIVRRNRIAGSKYTLYLSQVTKEEELIYYSTNRALADSKIGAAALYVLSGEYASGSTNICNYVYDSSGGGWLYTDNYGVDLGLTNDYFVDDIGISFSSSVPIVYSSTDIYSDKEQSSVYYAADTEFKDPFVLYPIISPTSTPTPTNVPSSGGGRPGSGTRPETGGQATGGGGLDFIINLFTMIWTKICSVPMSVDGYSINLQQIVIYGALVSIVGGFIMHFIFGRK